MEELKIFVAGATGRVATQLIDDLVAENYHVIAGARHPEKVKKSGHITPVKLDLHDDVDSLADTIAGANAIYFTAGSRGKDLLGTDSFGAVKLMQAAEKVGVKRFIMLSALFALEPEKWKDLKESNLSDYYIAKFFADGFLTTRTHLDYTILQPAVLTEEAGTGKITVDDGADGTNPIPDVAKTLAEIIKFPNTIHQVIKMRTGNTPIAQALEQL